MSGLRRRVGIGPLLALLPIAVLAATLLVWPRVSHYSAQGISFDYPYGWTVHGDLGPSSGAGSIYAVLGTLPWGPCDAYDINCHFAERLDRREIEIQVGDGLLLSGDFCAYALDRSDLVPRTDGIRVSGIHYIRIDGRPAIETEYSLDTTDYYLSDGWRKWEIAPADTTAIRYTISAMWRGPGDDEFLAELDRLVASIKLGPTPYGQASSGDCGAPFPPA
ncbi:MAG TPA: hypothetical protein VGM49_06985 [Candidatus Limnocylindrales bacterium]|jgi:hypothetical protein